MPHSTTITLNSEADVFKLLLDLRGKGWLSRGQSETYGSLIPSIDRGEPGKLSRMQKLECERASISLFRETARFFASPGEQLALNDDVAALMVLRHYGVQTRLLDWSIAPHVAAYFAVHNDCDKDGELWSFDRAHFELKGKEQWRQYPETTIDGTGDDPDKFQASLTAFLVDEPPDWIITGYYYPGFPRQDAQSGAYTITARFGRDHMEVLANVLEDDSKHRRYVIPAKFKEGIKRQLREQYGVWRGTLFPDSAGAADTARTAFDSSSSTSVAGTTRPSG